MKRTELGSTAIEIAITMAIISLLFTLTVKGRELVENSRAESLARDFRGIQSALYSYKDRLHPPQGKDFNNATLLLGSTAIVNNGNGNLRIDSKLNSALGESYFLWQHVKLATSLKGAANRAVTGYVPLSATGSALGVADISVAPISGISGDFIICSENVSGRLVQQLDMMMDDGNTAGGAMMVSRAGHGGEPVASGNIIESDFYLACLSV